MVKRWADFAQLGRMRKSTSSGWVYSAEASMRLLSTPSSSPPVHTEFDFQGHADFGHARQVFRADFNVLLQRLFRQVNHVRREQRLAGMQRSVFHPRPADRRSTAAVSSRSGRCAG